MLLYYDLGSPYAYLAVERAEAVLGRAPELRPVLLGGFFAPRGWGSWSQTEEREERMTDLAARAARYGLPPLRFPEGWPLNGLTAMRAATWARSDAFAREAFRRQFAGGVDISTRDALTDVAAAVGLGEPAFDDPAVKAALRDATEAAWAARVRGIPSLQIGDQLFYGDDQLEAALGPGH